MGLMTDRPLMARQIGKADAGVLAATLRLSLAKSQERFVAGGSNADLCVY